MPLAMFSTSLKITSHAALPRCLRLSKLIVESEGYDLNVGTRRGSAIKFAFTAETGFAIQHEMLVDVAIGSKPEVSALPSQVCSTLKSGHRPAGPACPHRAIRNRLNKTPVKSLAWKQPQVGFFS